jgi:hypothetical protein
MRNTLPSQGGVFRSVDCRFCEQAHVPPRVQAVLSDFDTRSAHYEVLDRREQQH